MSQLIIVPGRGPHNAPLMIVGERPGKTEAATGRPFTGRTGQEQTRYLDAAGLTRVPTYFTNLVKSYAEGDIDPTPADIAEWGPTLEQEIATVRPRYIIAAGRFAVRWFLGEDTDMESVHGIPHRSARVPGRVLLPCYHPAGGFYDEEARAFIAYDYRQAGLVIRGQIPSEGPVDALAGREGYIDVDGRTLDELAHAAIKDGIEEWAIDTEGVPGDEWSIQISIAPGTGLTLRRSRRDFERGIAALRCLADSEDLTCVLHNGMYDIEMCAGMGLDLRDARLFDTQYAAYLLRIEPQGLKPLAYRHAGMRMASYSDTVGQVGREKQLAYLATILEHAWPKPDPRIEQENDGTSHLYTPQPVEARAEAILRDCYSGKLSKDGEPTDPMARWKKVDRDLRRMVEAKLGGMPIGTLADIPLQQAITYASRDPDATLRVARSLRSKLAAAGLSELMQHGMDVLPVFEEMQRNGMPAIRSSFERLSADMWAEMCRLQAKISHRYYNDRPFNPASPDKVAALMRRRGLQGEKRSKKTGKVSTAKKSIEHLRYEDAAMADVIDWREHQKIKDAFADPSIERMGEVEVGRIRTTIKITRTVSRRISSSDPNLTAIPVRNELGLRVRDCFVAPDGYDLASFDLSQIEMRYMAHVSQDPLLHEFFHDPRKDMHAETAARIFGLKVYPSTNPNIDEAKKEMYSEIGEMAHRYPAKRAGFGIITNIMGAGLLDQLRMFGCKGWDVEKCDHLIEEWLKIYKGVARFCEDAKREAHRTGQVRSAWGMIRPLPGVYSADDKVVAEAERAASSLKIQDGAQGMLQRAMAWLRPYIRGLQLAGADVKWLLQIHDEILFEHASDLWDTIEPLVKEALTQHHGIPNISVPIKCSGTRAKTWGKLK